MNREVRLFLHAIHASSRWDSLLVRGRLGLSADARRKKRRYWEVHQLLASALADPDSVVEIELNARGKRHQTRWNLWASFGVLTLIAVMEWSKYTLPQLSDWIGTVLHRCGLR